MTWRASSYEGISAGRDWWRRKYNAAWGLLFFLLIGTNVFAQFPPGTVQQLDSAIGERVEATAVLGTQNIASRAGLGWKLNDADGTIFKIPWKFEYWDPQPMGDSGLLWTPVFEGGAGFGQFINNFDNNVLAGNESDFNTVALSMGTGPRIFFWDSGFSVLPAFDLLYAYTQNNFSAHTPLGQEVVDDGRYVNWTVHTISLVPSFEVQYKKVFGRWTPTLSSDFAYFDTGPIHRSTTALSFQSDSMAWGNRFDLDYLTAIKLFQCPMHVGADIVRTDVYEGLRSALGTDFYYETDGRVTFDLLGKIWKVKYVGLSAGYYWCPSFTGYSIGLEGSLSF